MTTQDVLSELERRMGPLDERTQRAVGMALDWAMPAWVRPVEPRPAPRTVEWQGENPPFEEMARLDMDERSRVTQELEDRNRPWLEQQLRELGARWMFVIDGEVVLYGLTLQTYPMDEELLELCHQTGKLPLGFMAPPLIEESTPWHPTSYADDFYATLPVAFHRAGQRADFVADFDTGASDTCVDADQLEGPGVVRFTPAEHWYFAHHLGSRFAYAVKYLEVVLTAADGTDRQAVQRILCVRDWPQSPFVTVNPNRTALVGRDLCLLLQPQVTLDFAQHETTVQW